MNYFQKTPLACSQGQPGWMLNSFSSRPRSSRSLEQLSRQSRYNPQWCVGCKCARTSNKHGFVLGVALVEITMFFIILDHVSTITRRANGMVRRIVSKILMISTGYYHDSRNSRVCMGWRIQ